MARVEVESRHGFCCFALTFVATSSSLPQNFCTKRNITTHTGQDWLLCNVQGGGGTKKKKTSGSSLPSSAFSSDLNIIVSNLFFLFASPKSWETLGSFGV